MYQIVKIRSDAKKWLSNSLLIIHIIVQNNRKRRDSLSSEADSWVKNGTTRENRDGFKPCKRKQDLHSRLPLRNLL